MGKNNILEDITYGLYLVTTKYNNEKAGCIINTLAQVTSQNPLVSITINKSNYTNEIIKKSKKFAVSILSENAKQEIISMFGYQTSRKTDKFKNYTEIQVQDIPVIKENITGYIICEVKNIIECETHDIFIAKIIESEKTSGETPMTYKYYKEVLKGTSPKNAPTFKSEEITSKAKRYRCKICGYIYDDSKEKVRFEDLKEDWVCPLCGAPKSMFERI